MEKVEKVRPIIALTVSAMKNDEVIINKICDYYLKKPISKSDFLTEIMNVLPYSKKEGSEIIYTRFTQIL